MASEAERKAATEAFAAAHEIPAEDVDKFAANAAFARDAGKGTAKIQKGRERAEQEMAQRPKREGPPFAKLMGQ